MAEKIVRVRMTRTIQGEGKDAKGEREILVAGSVIDLAQPFAGEVLASKAALSVESDEKLIRLPLHAPAEKR